MNDDPDGDWRMGVFASCVAIMIVIALFLLAPENVIAELWR